MRVFTTPLLHYVVLSLLLGCSAAPRVKVPPVWEYERGAIELKLASHPQLNLFQKKPHSLLICLYLLKDPSGFNQLVDEQGGLPKLLECSRFDPSVTYAKRLVVQPGQQLNEALDRMEGTRYLGLVAGYYGLEKQGSVRSYAIPVAESEQGSQLVQKPAKLALKLSLGSQGIEPTTTPSLKAP